MAIVYQHRRSDDNSIFYIGIGKTKSRAFSKKGRSVYWKNISSKYGFEVDVLFEGISWKEACDVEIGMISSYGRKDLGEGLLVNLTNGGDGTNGSTQSDLAKQKISNSLIGNKRTLGFKHSEESKVKMKESKTGGSHSEETKKKISLSNGKKVVDLNTGKVYSCVKEAAFDINVKHKTLISWLCGQNPNKSNLKYL
jgi:hypothetical protein